MRNVDPDRADQPQPEGAAVYTPGAGRSSRRRRQAVAGAVGLLAILGVGGLVTYQATSDDNNTTTVTDTGALAPLAPSATPGGLPSAVPPASVRPSSGPPPARATSAPAAAAPTSTSPRPRTSAERIAAARSAAAAAKASSNASRPLPAAGIPVADKDLKVTTTGSVQKDRATLKVYSARQDLTGQRELAWVTDEGEQVGSSRCTQKIRLSPDAPVKERPTLLLCWRTSAEKSVYTVAVKIDSPPSKQDSVAAIDREWAKLG